MRGEQQKKSAKQNLEIIDAANLHRIAYWRRVHRFVNILAQEYQSFIIIILIKSQNRGKQFAAFCLFMVTLRKNCALLSGNGKPLKLEMTTI